MQTISGVHFNFSLPDAVWSLLRTQDNSLLSLQQYKTEGYFKLIRNFRRWLWVLLYTMGASPIVSKSFLTGREHSLSPLPNDNDFFYLPHATSLRMGDLGYQSTAQDELFVCYNNLSSYISTLRDALLEPYPSYQAHGLADSKGQRHQLSNAVLQIENEFYSTVRPKQTAESGETQLKALLERGVEYVEVRCLDINPFDPLGIDATQINFLEVFLLTCLFDESPESGIEEHQRLANNQKTIVTRGREPDLQLETAQGDQGLADCATILFEKMRHTASTLNSLVPDERYTDATTHYQSMVDDPSKTPSSRLVREIESSGMNFIEWTSRQSDAFHNALTQYELDPTTLRLFEDSVTRSHDLQREADSASAESLEAYLNAYFDQYQQLHP